MEVRIRTPEPHSKHQNIIMRAFITRGIQEIWVACGTKFGKTMAAVCAGVLRVPITKGGVFRTISPIYSQSLISMRYARRFLPKHDDIIFKKSSDPSIVFVTNDTRWEFKTGKDPESLEGEATDGNHLDEASKMHPDVYASVKTTTTVTRGPILVTSTPRGKNHFYKNCMEVKQEMEHDLKMGRAPKKIFLTAPTSANPHVSQEAIDDAKRRLPPRLFDQYYRSIFVDDGAVFSNFRRCIYTDFMIEDSLWFNPDQGLDADMRIVGNVVIGVDWAKKVDYTVFTAWDFSTKKIIGFMRFQDVNYVEGVKNLMWFASRFTRVELVVHDQTGVGEPISELLDKTSLPYEGVIFTNKNKSAMINALIMAFQRGTIKIPFWAAMIQELESFEVQTNDLGTMKFSAPSGMHDDIVMSMILAWYAVAEFSDDSFDVKILEDEFEAPVQEDKILLTDYDKEIQKWEKLIQA